MVVKSVVDHEPLYQHECEECTYLGKFTIGGGDGAVDFDLYVHWDTLEKTVTARYGDGSDYISGIGLAHIKPELYEAIFRACHNGLIPEYVQYPVVVRECFVGPDSNVGIFFEELFSRLDGCREKIISSSLVETAKKICDDYWLELWEAGVVNCKEMPGYGFRHHGGVSLTLEFDDQRLSPSECETG